MLTAHQVLLGPRGQRISPGAVLIERASIAVVGSIAEVQRQAPREAHRRDYPHGTILPGFVNSHVHLAFNGSRDLVTALNDVGDSDLLRGMETRALQHLAAGVTTVRDLGDRHGLAVQVRAAIDGGATVGPRILAACAPLTPPGGHCWFLGGEVSGDDDIRSQVRHNAAVGADVIKVMGNGGQSTPGGPGMLDPQFSPRELGLIVAEAHTLGLPVAIHAYTSEMIASAVDAGVDTVEHCNFLGPEGEPDHREAVVAAMAARGVAASPALPSGWRGMWEALGEQRARSIADRLRWLAIRDVPRLFGSDAGVATSQHGDPVSTLEAYEHIGLPPPEVLELATSASAAHLGLSEATGALCPGLAADLVVVDGDPLRDLQVLRSPLLVLGRGQAYENHLRRVGNDDEEKLR